MDETSPIKATRAYIEIEAIFDVRLGALSLISPETAAEMMASEYYYNRQVDEFGSKKLGVLSASIFSDVYKNFFDDALRNSLPTVMYQHFIAMIGKILSDSNQVEEFNVTGVDVNIYPATFTDDEKQSLLEALNGAYGHYGAINIINKNPAEFTVDYINKNYLLMVAYNHLGITQAITEDQTKTHLIVTTDAKSMRNIRRVERCVIAVPRLLFRPLTKQEKEAFDKMEIDPFDHATKIANYCYNIEFIPLALFCADTDENTLFKNKLKK